MRTRNQHYQQRSAVVGKMLALSALVFALGIGALQANTVIWSEGFEGYNTNPGLDYGSLDKNHSGGANEAANGVGNPWFGPNPGNAWVTKEMTNPDPIPEVVTPHGGQFMIRGNRNDTEGWYNGWDNDMDHVNLAYRFNNGTPFTNNFVIEWWFYDMLGNTYPGDPDKGPGCFGDHAGISYNTAAPANTDYSNNGNIGSPATGTVTARLGIGAYEYGTGYDPSYYQVHVLGAADGQFGTSSGTISWGIGWFNSTLERTRGWHHAAISVDGNNTAIFSIDDTIVLTHDTGAPNGFNVFTTTELMSTPDTYNQSAYYDDITFSLITGPNITATSIANGTNLVVQANDGLVGWTYTLLTATSLSQPKNEWTPVATSLLSASGAFTMVGTNAVSGGSSKAFFLLQGAIQP